MGRGSGGGGGGFSHSSHSSSRSSFSSHSSRSSSRSSFSSSRGSSSRSSLGRSSSFGSRRTINPPPPPRSIPHQTTIYNTTVIPEPSTLYYEDTYDEEKRKKSPISSLVHLLFLMIMFSVFFALLTPAKTSPVEKLDAKQCIVENWDDMIVDNLGWITEDQGSTGIKHVKEGLQYFYQKTGIQPMVVITDKLGDADAFNTSGDEIEKEMDNLYDKNFKDNAHMIFLVLAKDGSDDYDTINILNRTAADLVLGEKQKDIIYNRFDHYWYNTSEDECDLIRDTFITSADQIMAKPSNAMKTTRNIAFFIDGILILAIVIMFVSHNKTKRQEEENRHSEAVNEQYNQVIREAEKSGTPNEDDSKLINKYK